MQNAEIVNQIENLSISERMAIVEKIIRSIRIENEKIILEKAADILYDDYKNDKELTAFTCLDCEDFYEPR